MACDTEGKILVETCARRGAGDSLVEKERSTSLLRPCMCCYYCLSRYVKRSVSLFISACIDTIPRPRHTMRRG